METTIAFGVSLHWVNSLITFLIKQSTCFLKRRFIFTKVIIIHKVIAGVVRWVNINHLDLSDNAKAYLACNIELDLAMEHLLYALDKAGIAEILEMLQILKDNPTIKHPELKIAFTPDEEIGTGSHSFNVPEFDADFAAKLESNPAFATSILAIGRGGKKPRKDLAVWKDAKDYMGFFYDEYLQKPVFDEKFSNETVIDALTRFLEKFDIADDSAVWFEKVKEITNDMGFTTDMKAYKADPSAFPGTVADISTFIRQAVTGKTNSPDLYTVMQILGYERTVARIQAVIATL